MAKKDWFLMPMYRVNAISGRPYKPNGRLSAVEEDRDYVVVPGQPWIDGIATEPGVVRQFVASPFGSRESVEAYVKAEETEGGIMFEIVGILQPPPLPPFVPVRIPTSPQHRWKAPDVLIEEVKNMIAEQHGQDGLPMYSFDQDLNVRTHRDMDSMRLIFSGKQLEILNSKTFTKAVSLPPPMKSMALRQYEEKGGILFSFPEPASDIKGEFSTLKETEGVDEEEWVESYDKWKKYYQVEEKTKAINLPLRPLQVERPL
ncbi:hypothetical protein QBC44DRAFT_386104 [Cladorrhinum sp. PSN332]|nr:hypothetical protein QBC44DRAFT_386104 [Cladorrhinum sp. PSN332]